jgi:hypothetical protein
MKIKEALDRVRNTKDYIVKASFRDGLEVKLSPGGVLCFYDNGLQSRPVSYIDINKDDWEIRHYTTHAEMLLENLTNPTVGEEYVSALTESVRFLLQKVIDAEK